MTDDSFDVNSELYFNEKLNYWLNTLTVDDVHLILTKCFHIPIITPRLKPTICPWDSVDPTFGKTARFDQKIDFGKEFSIIFELKVGTEATVGQLDKYLQYLIGAGYKKGFVVLLSRNALASEKLGYDKLRGEHSNLLFITWREFESELRGIHKTGLLQSPKRPTEDFLYLLTFLTDIQKRSERLIIQPEPPQLDVLRYMKTLDPAPPPKKTGPFLVWKDRNDFWSDLLAHLAK